MTRVVRRRVVGTRGPKRRCFPERRCFRVPGPSFLLHTPRSCLFFGGILSTCWCMGFVRVSARNGHCSHIRPECQGWTDIGTDREIHIPHKDTNTYTRARTRAHTHTRTNTHIRTHTHTHTNTHTQNFGQPDKLLTTLTPTQKQTT